jgi:CIC family chloride channel protein
LLSPAAYELSVGASDTAWALMALLVAVTMLKAVATCLTVGTGGAGGLFAPSLFIGASVGGLFGVVAQALPMGAAGNPAHYALVGMAAMLAATTHAPLTGILIVYEITRSHEIVLPVMFAAVISTVAARLLLRDSVYTWPLSRRGVRVGAMSDLTILRRLAAREVPLSPAIEVHEDDSAQRLLDLSETHAVGDFVVVDDRRQYAGMVTGADLRAALVYREAIPLLQVSELQRSDLPTVSPDESLDVVLDKFSRHDVPSLAVLDPGRDGAVLGLISRAKLMQVYQGALSKD